jgi:hypothetical protein
MVGQIRFIRAQKMDLNKYIFKYYWKCCEDKENPATSWDNARSQLEEHEKEKHKGKPIGTIGCVKIYETK